MAIHPGIFRQYDIRGIVDRDLTTEAATAIGRAYATLLRDRGIQGTIAVGRDNRPSGGILRDALIEGLTSAGAHVVDIGVVPTPVLFCSLHLLSVVGSIQISVSLNTPDYIVFKL
jgi:phosphomannomutase/phosphoglucomutase